MRRTIAREASRVFSLNEVDTGTEYYHMPNARIYPSLFAWDSAYNSIAMLHLDPERSKRELETVFAQVCRDGHMPHEVLVPCAATRAHPLKNLMRWLVQWQYDSRRASHLSDPPAYIYAAELVYERTGDRGWLRRIWGNLSRCLDYLLDSRDVFGDGLVAIFHPWEAGTDLSPQLLPAMGIDPRSRLDAIKSAWHAVTIYRFGDRRSWDPRALAEANRFVVEDLTMNCLVIRALRSAARLAPDAGDEPAAASRYRSRAGTMSEALERVCWDEEAGCYFPRWDFHSPRLARVKTAASLLPMFTGLARPERVERLVREHLRNPAEFQGDYPLPFNPADELVGFRPWLDSRLWSGHCIWINFNWMIARGLSESGYPREALEITERTARMVAREGFWEYYDSRTGAGRRIRDFTWPALVLDMIGAVTRAG